MRKKELLQEPREPKEGWWTLLAAFLITVIMLLLLSACSPRIIERVSIQRDTTYITRTDSVRFYDRDSIFIKEKGDTVYKYVEKWRWRDRVRVDTVLRVKVDSVAVESIKEVQVAKPLSWWQKFRLGAFWWLLAGCLALGLWTTRKLWLKFII